MMHGYFMCLNFYVYLVELVKVAWCFDHIKALL